MIGKKEAKEMQTSAEAEAAQRVQTAYNDYEKKIDKHITNKKKEFRLRTNNRYEVEALHNLLNDYRGESWKVTAKNEDTYDTEVNRTGWYTITFS